MKRRIDRLAAGTAVLLVLFGVLCLLLGRENALLGWIAGGVWLLALIGAAVAFFRWRQILSRTLAVVSDTLDPARRQSLEGFSMPLMAVGADGEIVYVNELFRQQITDGEIVVGQSAGTVFPGFSMAELMRRDTVDLQHGTLRLTAYVRKPSDDGLYLLYIADTTALKRVAAEYTATRPVVLFISIDNLEETTRDRRESDGTRIAGTVEGMLDQWITARGGLLRKFATDRFMALADNRALGMMTKERFSILDDVRSAFGDTQAAVTLSVGVGQGQNLPECEQMAREALDMAMARGGDQAAVKTGNGFDFYGGRSRGVERRTKVRSRQVATALRNMMTAGDCVVTMGHRMSDLDSLGSATALAVAARKLGVRAYVAVHRRSTVAQELILRYEAAGVEDLFVEPEELLDDAGERMLLIVTDTHAVSMLDCPELYRKCPRVVLIDHHRKMVEHIDNAALEHHIPTSSSACELVTELLQYMGKDMISPPEAEALLAGIMLDTRNFVLRTGVRTFEAAAYLRQMGADTVAVKRLFSGTLENYRKKSELVNRATLFGRVAIAVTEEDFGDRRTVAAQAADELLSVNGTRASFVIVRSGKDAVISARSYGDFNVQLVMEAMGGGGHMTMAGTQLKDTPVAVAEQTLKERITDYHNEYPEK